MVTEDEARTRAEAWVRTGDPRDTLGMRAFDLGWVVWAQPPPPDDPAAVPDRIGAPRAVVDRETGEMTFYPPQAVDDVADRYRTRAEARRRFSAEVADVLLEAGWFPGRRLPADEVAAWEARLRTLRPAGDGPPLVLSDAARAVVAEFGGLRLRGVRTSAEATGDGGFRPVSRRVPILFHPSDRLPDTGLLEILDLMPTPWAPIATLPPTVGEEVALDERGRVFGVSAHHGGGFLIADTVDGGIAELVHPGHRDVVHEVTEYGLAEVPVGPRDPDAKLTFVERWDPPAD